MAHSCTRALGTAGAALFIGFVPPVLGFDDDRDISDVRLKPETFLDLNANAYRRSVDLAWIDVENGWRMAGGSTSTNRLFLESDFRFRQTLSPKVSVGVSQHQDDFYATKPLQLPKISVDVYPVQGLDLGISVLGTAALDKRQADLGYAFTLGRLSDDYIRFEWLKVDAFYNEKNEFDDSRYAEFAETLSLSGKSGFNEHWVLKYQFDVSRPLVWLNDLDTEVFEHESRDYEASLYYRNIEHTYGVRFEGFDIDKSLTNTSSNRAQTISYKSIESFVFKALSPRDELTVGVRYDKFDDDVEDRRLSGEGSDLALSTWQLYASHYHQYDDYHAWDVGVFAGWSDFDQGFDQPDSESPNERSEGVEAKLRGSWQVHSIDKHSVLALNLSLNLDALFTDPGDGGGIYFQTRF